jgi:hypothetical protein
LFCENLISDFLAVRSYIWAKTKDALKDDNTKGVVINSHAVVATAHHFWSHISRSPRSVSRIFRLPNPSHSKVGNSWVPFLVEHDVFRLEVTMYYALVVQKL